MPAERIFFLPMNRRGQGTGHMRRCFDFARRCTTDSSLILDTGVPDVRSAGDWAAVIPGFPGQVPIIRGPGDPDSSGTRRITSPGPGFLDTLVVFDRRNSNIDDLQPWADIACPVLLDDNGTARKSAPYVVDTLPGPRSGEANISSPGWLNLPRRTRRPDPEGAILVSFGGDDPSLLTIPVTDALVGVLKVSPGRVWVTLPGNTSAGDLPGGAHVLDSPGDLKQQIGRFGLVLCSYGLTAWEAVASGAAVITVDPTRYHAGLSKYSGFPGIGHIGVPGIARNPGLTAIQIRRLGRLLNNPEYLADSVLKVSRVLGENHESKDLTDLFSSLEAPAPLCAACGKPFPGVIARFPDRSYYLCRKCGITGLYRFELKENEYGPSYFDQEYRDQYGRSYLEDFDAIKTMAASRLRIIRRRTGAGASLLDIGCAFGPFLDASREAGFRPFGTDVSDEGVAHVNRTLGIPAVTGRFPADNPAAALDIGNFDVVTLWYVIEHFADLRPVLEALNTLVSPGGVLAFSTPNGMGISGRRSYRRFLENSPADHYTVWSPRVARRLLKQFGFRVCRIRVTGHHPERFRIRFFGLFSRILRLGDTFEVYAVKESSVG